MRAAQAQEIPASNPRARVATAVVGRTEARGDNVVVIAPEPARRVALGQIVVDLRAYDRQHCIQLTPNATTIHMLVPMSGAVVAVSYRDHQHVTPGSALLLTRRQRADCIWTANSSGLILHIPTTLLQQAVAKGFTQPRRLAEVSEVFALRENASELASLLLELERMIEGNDVASAEFDDGRIAAAIVAALRTDDEDGLFPISRSLQRASEYLLARPDSNCTADELASIAGVTLRTLRHNVKACLGIPLARFVEQVRLTWVRDRLCNTMESRSLAELAQASGYSSPNTLSRSYQRLFGETPTQTRSRAFAATRR